jgi:hypothetical protein
MEEYQEVVFKEDMRVAIGSQVVPFKANVPRKVSRTVATKARLLGAITVVVMPEEGAIELKPDSDAEQKPKKKRAPKRDA